MQRVILIKWDKNFSTRTARGDVEVLGISDGAIVTLQKEVYCLNGINLTISLLTLI